MGKSEEKKLHKQAEKMFFDNFDKGMIQGNVESFKRSYRTLYYKVIIPSIVQALETYYDEQISAEDMGHVPHLPTKQDKCPTKAVIDSAVKSVKEIQLPKIARTEFDTLQEGDWFTGTVEQYRSVLGIILTDSGVDHFMRFVLKSNYIAFDGKDLGWVQIKKQTELTPEEFLRRAENTFKNKN